MDKYYCPIENDSEPKLTLVMNRSEAWELKKSLNNAERWEDLNDTSSYCKDYLTQFSDYCDDLDHRRATAQLAAEREEDSRHTPVEPNVQLDAGVEDGVDNAMTFGEY